MAVFECNRLMKQVNVRLASPSDRVPPEKFLITESGILQALAVKLMQGHGINAFEVLRSVQRLRGWCPSRRE